MKIEGAIYKNELRAKYGCCATTWLNWLKPLKEKFEKIPGYNARSKRYKPREVELIIELLGEP
jgi:hypothetical protein